MPVRVTLVCGYLLADPGQVSGEEVPQSQTVLVVGLVAVVPEKVLPVKVDQLAGEVTLGQTCGVRLDRVIAPAVVQGGQLQVRPAEAK